MDTTVVPKTKGLPILLDTTTSICNTTVCQTTQLVRLLYVQGMTRTFHTAVGPENICRAPPPSSFSLSLSASNEHKHLLDIFLHILTFSNCLPAPIHTFHNMAINCSLLLSSIGVHSHDCSLALFPV